MDWCRTMGCNPTGNCSPTGFPPSRLHAGIQPPDREVQRGRKPHPRQMGQHQNARHPSHAPARHQGRRQRQPEREDVDQREAWAMQAENQRRAQRVHHPLQHEQSQRPSLRAPAALAPDQPRGDGHRRVEKGPGGGENPRGRIPRRLVEAGIPAVRGNECRRETQCKPAEQGPDLKAGGRRRGTIGRCCHGWRRPQSKFYFSESQGVGDNRDGTQTHRGARNDRTE